MSAIGGSVAVGDVLGVTEIDGVAVTAEVAVEVLVAVAVFVGVVVGGQTNPGTGKQTCASTTLVSELATMSDTAPNTSKAGMTRNRTSNGIRIQPPLN
jgi:hypothetical protein